MIKLVLVRHGESEWNLENKFTGWTDVDLSENGIKEAKDAGKVLKEKGFTFDVAYTSVLKRANHTLDLILEELGLQIPINYSWRLNERQDDDPRFPSHDDKYKDLDYKDLPHTECLLDTVERVIPYWKSDIEPALKDNKKVIVVAHGNSLRGLIKYLDNLSDEEIVKLEIETGNPICYELDDNLKPIKHYYLKGE